MAKKRGEQNPKPRIGRKDKQLEFSKKLKKQYPKTREKETESQKPKPLPPTWVHFQEDTYLINKLAIIANEYGIDGAANILNIDENLLDYALRGNILTRQQQGRLEVAYGSVMAEDEPEIDIEKVEDLGKSLQQAVKWVNEERFHGDELKDSFRYLVSRGQVSEEDLIDRGNKTAVGNLASYAIFAEGITPKIKNMIINYFVDNPDETMDEFFEAYISDKQHALGIWHDPDLTNSDFWKWFRETFYS